MTMDVYGMKPTSARGRYFGANLSGWCALADYALEVAPEVCAPCKYWGANDGDGLDAAGAIALADALQTEIKSGRTAAYAEREHPIDPDDEFDLPPAQRGKRPHWFIVRIEELAGFLRDSGGFEIH